MEPRLEDGEIEMRELKDDVIILEFLVPGDFWFRIRCVKESGAVMRSLSNAKSVYRNRSRVHYDCRHSDNELKPAFRLRTRCSTDLWVACGPE